MRVLHIINYFPPARTRGGEVAAYHSCLGMRRRGVECAVLCINTRQPAVEQFYRIAGIPVHQVYRQTPRRVWSDVFMTWVYRMVLEEIRCLKPDLIHTHNVSGMSLAPFVAARRAGVPVVTTLHDHWLLCPNNMLYRADGTQCDPAARPRCKDCYQRYDFWGNVPQRRQVFATLTANVYAFISPSAYLIAQHVRAGYAPQRFRLIYHGMPYPESVVRTPALGPVLADLGRYKRLLYVGGAVHIKGIETIVAVLPILAQRLRDFRLLMGGGDMGPYTRPLLEFRPMVQLLGPISFWDMSALYNSADLTAMPSIVQESFGLVAAESLLVGTPVVGSALGGIPEIVTDHETGYLVPSADPQALAERVIEHFSLSAHQRRQMRRACVLQGRRVLSWDNHLDSLHALYQEAA